MDLNRVATFVRVVEAGSFTAAARALRLPTSSVSRAVSRLERDLGIRLLRRTTRQLNLTEPGRAYFEQARPAIQSVQTASCAVASLRLEPRGTVRLTAPADAGGVLAGLLASFRKRCPEVRVELSLTSRHVDLVAEGFDLALRGGELADSSLVATRIAVTRAGVFASPAFLRKRRRPRAVADLADHPCVLFRGKDGRATWKLTGPDGVQEAVEVRGGLDCDELSFGRHAALAGMGLSLLPISFCRDDLAARRLVRVLPGHFQDLGPLSLVTPNRGFEPIAVKLLREALHHGLLEVLGS